MGHFAKIAAVPGEFGCLATLLQLVSPLDYDSFRNHASVLCGHCTKKSGIINECDDDVLWWFFREERSLLGATLQRVTSCLKRDHWSVVNFPGTSFTTTRLATIAWRWVIAGLDCSCGRPGVMYVSCTWPSPFPGVGSQTQGVEALIIGGMRQPTTWRAPRGCHAEAVYVEYFFFSSHWKQPLRTWKDSQTTLV